MYVYGFGVLRAYMLGFYMIIYKRSKQKTTIVQETISFPYSVYYIYFVAGKY